jgi:hypothetical protein
MSSSFGDGAAQTLLQREPDVPEEQEEHQLHAVGITSVTSLGTNTVATITHRSFVIIKMP